MMNYQKMTKAQLIEEIKKANKCQATAEREVARLAVENVKLSKPQIKNLRFKFSTSTFTQDYLLQLIDKTKLVMVYEYEFPINTLFRMKVIKMTRQFQKDENIVVIHKQWISCLDDDEHPTKEERRMMDEAYQMTLSFYDNIATHDVSYKKHFTNNDKSIGQGGLHYPRKDLHE